MDPKALGVLQVLSALERGRRIPDLESVARLGGLHIAAARFFLNVLATQDLIDPETLGLTLKGERTASWLRRPSEPVATRYRLAA
ncbi:MAG: hypothetical protein AAGF12_06420 [Myxococcota bacterium]